MIENWVYNDIVLYSKGWYKSHGNMVEDLAYLLKPCEKTHVFQPWDESHLIHC